MKNRMKKLLSVVASVAMCGNMLLNYPSETLRPDISIFAADEGLFAGGTCGENLTWSLNTEPGVLTISGTGDMDDFDFITPWSDYNRIITKVVVESGVTSIGNHAFGQSRSVTEVELADTVTRLGETAFNSAPLTKIDLPDSLEIIECYAFGGCDRLTAIEIPDSVKIIGDHAFIGCRALEEIDLPDSLEEIAENTFRNCASLKSITIPESVTDIGKCAFYGCTALSEIVIPESVETIASDAFEDCTGLTSVTILCGWKDELDFGDAEMVYTHSFENGVCSLCGEVCEHEAWENNFCTNCGIMSLRIGGVYPNPWESVSISPMPNAIKTTTGFPDLFSDYTSDIPDGSWDIRDEHRFWLSVEDDQQDVEWIGQDRVYIPVEAVAPVPRIPGRAVWAFTKDWTTFTQPDQTAPNFAEQLDLCYGVATTEDSDVGLELDHLLTYLTICCNVAEDDMGYLEEDRIHFDVILTGLQSEATIDRSGVENPLSPSEDTNYDAMTAMVREKDTL